MPTVRGLDVPAVEYDFGMLEPVIREMGPDQLAALAYGLYANDKTRSVIECKVRERLAEMLTDKQYQDTARVALAYRFRDEFDEAISAGLADCAEDSPLYLHLIGLKDEAAALWSDAPPVHDRRSRGPESEPDDELPSVPTSDEGESDDSDDFSDLNYRGD